MEHLDLEFQSLIGRLGTLRQGRELSAHLGFQSLIGRLGTVAAALRQALSG